MSENNDTSNTENKSKTAKLIDMLSDAVERKIQVLDPHTASTTDYSELSVAVQALSAAEDNLTKAPMLQEIGQGLLAGLSMYADRMTNVAATAEAQASTAPAA